MKLPATDPFWSLFKRGPCCEICRKALLPEHDMARYSPNPPTWYWVHTECFPTPVKPDKLNVQSTKGWRFV